MGANSVAAELVDGCNLKCVLCWNRDREQSFRQMSLATCQKIIDRYRNEANTIITWYNFGEPLLFKEFEQLSEMIKGTHSYISTNFSLPISDERLKAMLNFEGVLVSISGMDDQTYDAYHKRGNLNLVIENIKRYSELKPTNARLRWLKHPLNAHHLVPAQKWADSMGWLFDAIELNCDVEECLSGFNHPFLKTFKIRSASSCRLIPQICFDVDGNYLLCCQSRNVKLGPGIDDSPTNDELRELKLKNHICAQCRAYSCWRMYYSKRTRK